MDPRSDVYAVDRRGGWTPTSRMTAPPVRSHETVAAPRWGSQCNSTHGGYWLTQPSQGRSINCSVRGRVGGWGVGRLASALRSFLHRGGWGSEHSRTPCPCHRARRLPATSLVIPAFSMGTIIRRQSGPSMGSRDQLQSARDIMREHPPWLLSAGGRAPCLLSRRPAVGFSCRALASRGR